MSSKVNSPIIPFESDLNSIVREYLNFASFASTVDSFDHECHDKSRPVSGLVSNENGKKTNKRAVALQNQLMQLFQHGERKDFFRVWSQSISHHILEEDTHSKKLEFLLHVYFVAYPLKKGIPSKKDVIESDEAMAKFKQFIETRGAELSSTEDFVPFFAMPYAQNIRSHPTFSTVFQAEWTDDLGQRLEQFLTMTLESCTKPRIFDMYRLGNQAKDLQHDVQRLQQQVLNAEKRAMHYMKVSNRLQTDYHGLISITAELVDSLEATIRGDNVTPAYLQQICERLFNNKNIASSLADIASARPGTAGQLLRSSIAAPLTEQETARFVRQLSFSKIKATLLKGGAEEQGPLLQALRWQLTRSQPGPARDAVLAAYIANDIFGCTSEEGQTSRDIAALLTSESSATRQYAARLFNTVASLCRGRAYMSKNSDFVDRLINVLCASDSLAGDDHTTCTGTDLDTIGKEHVLGCLQKLSLRKDMQHVMINKDVIDWLVRVLSDVDNLSDYVLEYGVALLMNLCLRTAGKQKCAANPQPVVKVLSDLLGIDQVSIKPYVNGALYSILSHPTVRDHALAVGLDEVLRCFMRDDQPDLTRQLHFIIKQLQKTSSEVEQSTSDTEEDEDDDDEQDSLEVDLDKDEIIKPKGTIPSEQSPHIVVASGPLGDQLLAKQFMNRGDRNGQSRKNSATNKASYTTDQSLAITGTGAGSGPTDEFIRRPITPATGRDVGSAILQRRKSQQPQQQPPTPSQLPPRSRTGSRAETPTPKYSVNSSSHSGGSGQPTTVGRQNSRPETTTSDGRPRSERRRRHHSSHDGESARRFYTELEAVNCATDTRFDRTVAMKQFLLPCQSRRNRIRSERGDQLARRSSSHEHCRSQNGHRGGGDEPTTVAPHLSSRSRQLSAEDAIAAGPVASSRPPTRAGSTANGQRSSRPATGAGDAPVPIAQVEGGRPPDSAFSSRPKIPRTPDIKGLPQPKYSGVEPRQRPGSGGNR